MNPPHELSSTSGPILITGATGSLGQTLVEQLLTMPKIGEIRVFSRDEHKQHLLQQRFNDPRLRMILGDVRDRRRLEQALRGCGQVIHLAAMKHVPACEAHPSEAVNTNVIGAVHLADAAIAAGIEKLLFISTDKAVSPINLYGATKLVGEKVLLAANQSPGNETRFSGIRFGNFFGSRGDVVSLFQRQRQSGTLRVTDKRMTRFWMTLEEAARFTLARLASDEPDGIFIPKLRALALVNLAKAMGPDCELREIGRRAGEKLHEHLISQDEAHLVRDFGQHYVLFANEALANTAGGQQVPANFELRSDQTEHCWSEDDLARLFQGAGASVTSA